MSAKLEKVVKDIEKVKERMNTAKEALKSLEEQRDELEKVELVHTLRTLKLKPSDLKVFIDNIKNQTNVTVPVENTVPAENTVVQLEVNQNPEIIYREVEDEE